MSPITDTSLFRARADIADAMLLALQGAVPDLYVGEDGIARIIFEVEAAQLENAFLANQLLLEEIFPQTASSASLERYGDMYGLPFKAGEKATGQVTFTGGEGTAIPVGAVVGAEVQESIDPISFLVTGEGAEIPDPGDPNPLAAAIDTTAGNLAGTYEYVVTFLTIAGETLPSDISNAISPVNQRGSLTSIQTGNSPDCIGRRIYRRLNGIGDFRLVVEIDDNTTVTFTDNVPDSFLTTYAPTVDTAHRVTVDAEAQDVGAQGNVVIGAITLLLNVPSGITDATNEINFSGGENPETPEEFRTRFLNYMRNPRTGSSDDLKFWAQTDNEVEEATIFNNMNLLVPQNGHVTVRISGPAGQIPSDDTVTEVQELLDSQDLANITIHVATFDPLSLNVNAAITAAYPFTIGDVTPSVQQAIADYIYSIPHGDVVYVSGIVDAVFGLSGVLDVQITTPTTNQAATQTQKFVPGTVTVTSL